METDKLTKRKMKLFITLLGNLAIAVVASIVVYFILALFNIMAYALLTYQVLLQGRENGGAGQSCSEEISEARA